jgi:hypothetical protein
MKRIQIQELWYTVEIKIWDEDNTGWGYWLSLKTYADKPYISEKECLQTIKEYLPEFNKDILENRSSKSLNDKNNWRMVEWRKYSIHPYFYWKTVDNVADIDRDELQQRWKELYWD